MKEETWLQVRLTGAFCLTALAAGLPCALAWGADMFANMFGDAPLGRLWAFVPGLAVALAVGNFVGRRLEASIRPVMRLAESVAKSEQRLNGLPEGGLPAGGLVDARGAFPELGRAINRMAERMAVSIQSATERQERLEAILDGMREGVMALNARGQVEAVNPALEVIAGAKAEKLLGRTPLEALVSPELDAACEAMLKAQPAKAGAVSQGEASNFKSIQVELRDGRTYDVSLVRAQSGHGAAKVVAVFHDVSEIRRLERMRRDFVANVSHELRTPLTSIKGYAETLLIASESTGKGDGAAHAQEASRPFLEIILKNANHMSKMVDDLLNLARLEAGRQQFNVARVDAAASLQAALRESSALAQSRGIRVENRVEAGKAFVDADADRLTQVFRNLLENAFRYGPEKSTVTVEWAHAPDGRQAEFSVRDEGPGVPESERQRIFERFYRLEKHRVKNAGSSGLGLAIAKHIVERMGGRISVGGAGDRDPGKADESGAVFRFTAPLASQAPDEPNQPDRPESPHAPSAPGAPSAPSAPNKTAASAHKLSTDPDAAPGAMREDALVHTRASGRRPAGARQHAV